jgi:hypothetical protein
MWSVENERRNAQECALRAAMLEELGLPEIALIFRDLVALSDMKMNLYNRLKSVDSLLASPCNKTNSTHV